MYGKPESHALRAYQQKDEEFAQSPSALAAAVGGAVGANTRSMTV